MKKSVKDDYILNLHLTYKWFGEIKSGRKKEENRAINDHNLKLMCNFDSNGEVSGFKSFKIVRFYKAYTDEFIDVEVKGIYLDVFMDNIPEGLHKGDQLITIDLGNIITNV